jgi:hypothetical protein
MKQYNGQILDLSVHTMSLSNCYSSYKLRKTSPFARYTEEITEPYQKEPEFFRNNPDDTQ